MNISVNVMAQVGHELSNRKMSDAEAVECFRFMWTNYVEQDERFLTPDEILVRRNIIGLVENAQKGKLFVRATVNVERSDSSSSFLGENPKRKTGIMRMVAGLVKKVENLGKWRTNHS